MLVTPDCVLFDPDESCPLVLKHGIAKYYMCVPKHSVLSVSVYHEKDASTFLVNHNSVYVFIYVFIYQ